MRRFVLSIGILLALCAGARSSFAAPAPVFVPPKLTHFVEAETPPSLETRGPTEVVLLIDVDEHGAPKTVAVQTSAGGDDAAAYDDAAIAAAKQFVFEPGTADGKGVPVRVTYRYRFVLKPPTPPPTPTPTPTPSPSVVPISGQVRRAGDRTPLAGIFITLDDSDTELLTDENGRFSMPTVAVGKHIFHLRSGDISPSDVKIELKEGKRVEVTWYVASKTRYASTVHGKRVVQETVEYTLSADEVKRIPGTQGDTLKAVQNLPGVARSSFGGGQIAVWGSSPGDTRTYVDGVQIPVLFHFGGLRSTINSEVIEDLRFLPGGYSADYGRGMGGVILIDTKRPRTDGVPHGFVQLDLIDGSLMLEGKITKNLSFSVGARRSWIDAFIPLFTTSDFQLKPVYYDYQGRLSWRVTPKDDIDVLLFGSDDVLTLSLKQPDPALSAAFNTHTYYHRALVRWTHRFNNGATLTITPSAGYDVPFRVDAQIGNIPFSVDARLTSYNLRAVARIPVTKWLRIDAGIDFEGNRWDISALAPQFGMPREGDTGGSFGSFTKVDTTFYLHKVAPYVLTDFTFLDGKISISPQVRLETYDWSSYRTGQEYNHAWFRVEPRLQMRFQVHPKVALKAAVGLYDQPPDPLVLTPGFGSPDIKPQVALHYVLGVEAKPWTKGFVQVQLFYKDLYDLITRGPTPFSPLYTNLGRGRVYGADFFIRQELYKNFFGWISYTVSRSERKDTPDDLWRVFRLDQTHIFTLIASYKLPKGFQVGLRFRVVTGNPITPVRGAFFDNNDGSYQPVYGTNNSDRLNTFHQLDLRVDKDFVFNRWKMSIYLDIQNLYYAKNPEGLAYNFDYSLQQPITGLPILPVFGVRGDF